MLQKIIDSFNPIVILVFITFSIGLFFLNKKVITKKLLFFILLNYCVTEVLSIYLILNNKSVGFLYNISIFIQFFLWLLLLSIIFKKHFLHYVLPFSVFVCFSLIDRFLEFNSTNFIIGSFIYLIIYIYENLNLLKKDDLVFFQSNNYLLVNIPLIFFLGMSFLFAFNSNKLTTTIVLGDIKLYTFINYFVNIIYYFLINLYIYKEARIKND